MKLSDIILEAGEKMYETLAYIEYTGDVDITRIIQLIRALPEVTVVNNRSDKDDPRPRGYVKIKLITNKTGVEAFNNLKQNALNDITELNKFNFVPENIRKNERF
jgi:hypothetical protein